MKKSHMTSKPDAVEYKQDMHQAMWASSVYAVILAMASRKKNQHVVINRIGSVLPFLAEMVRVVLLEAAMVVSICSTWRSLAC